MSEHPSPADIDAAAAGDPEVRSRTAQHFAVCSPCAQRLAHVLGVLEAAAVALGPDRAACPPVEVLAGLPPGAEMDDPHIGDCPLCRGDLELIRAVEARNRLGESFSDGVPHRPQRLIERDAGYVQSTPGASLKLGLIPGAKKSGSVAGATIALEVAGDTLSVTVTGAPEVELELVLENESFEKVVRIEGPAVNVDLGRWLRAEVRRSGKA